MWLWTLHAEASPQNFEKVVSLFLCKIIHKLLQMFGSQQELSLRVKHTVALKALLLAALLLAHLAVPAKLLGPFGLYPVRDGLEAQKILLTHDDPEHSWRTV